MIRAFEQAGVSGLFISDQVFPNRCGYLPGKQIVSAEQMLAKVKAALDGAPRPRPVHRSAHRCGECRGRRSCDRALSVVHGSGSRHGEADGLRHHSGHQAGRCARFPDRTGRRCRKRPAPRRGACRNWKRPAVCSATFPSLGLFAAANAVRNVLRVLKKSDTLAPRAEEHTSSRSRIIYDLVGLKPLLTREEKLRQGSRGVDRAARSGVGGMRVCAYLTAARLRAIARPDVQAHRRRPCAGLLQRTAKFSSLSATRSATTTTSGRGFWRATCPKQPARPARGRGAEHAASSAALAAANFIYTRAPRDGSVIGSISSATCRAKP